MTKTTYFHVLALFPASGPDIAQVTPVTSINVPATGQSISPTTRLCEYQERHVGSEMASLWSTWNGYNLRTHPGRGRRALQRHRKAIGQSWRQIITDHPNDYEQVRVEICNAIRQVTALEKEIGKTQHLLRVLERRKEDEGVHTKAEPYEALAVLQLRLSAAVTELSEVERRVGPTADHIRRYDEERVQNIAADIRATYTLISIARTAEEVNADGRDQRRKDWQSHMQVDVRPGGRNVHKIVGQGECIYK